MVRSVKYAVLAFIALGLFGDQLVSAPKITVDYLLKRVESIRTFQADFIQRISVQDFDEAREARGVLYVSRPDKFLLKFKSPFTDFVLVNGDDMWVYSAENEQALQENLESSPGFKAFFFNFTEFYTPEILGEGEGGNWKVKLVPKGEKDLQGELFIWIDGRRFYPVKFEHVDLNNTRTDYIFANIKVNSRLSPDLFLFKPPPGTEIFKQF